jgi:hypothetical protein
MIKKLEKCIKRYINDNLTKDWYDEDEFGDKINEIIDFINKKEEVTITITPGEYNIWGNNPEIQKDYISKKELKEFINLYNSDVTRNAFVKQLIHKFNL